MTSLDDLPGPAIRALELALEAFHGGSFPAGAVIVDQQGRTVAEGQNRVHADKAPESRPRRSAIAHAEVDALYQLPLGDYRDHTLFTSLEPCLLCRSAAGMSRIGTVYYVGRDVICEGLSDLTLHHHHTARLAPNVSGVGSGDVAVFASLLPLAYIVHCSRDPETLKEYRTLAPALTSQAEQLVATNTWPTPGMGLEDTVTYIMASVRHSMSEQSLTKS